MNALIRVIASSSNPLNHTLEHLNRFYTIPPAITQKLFPLGTLPKLFEQQINTFCEHTILVREPAVEVISYLQQTDYSKSINKYVLYGEKGSGKTMTLSHILHYGLEAKQVLVNVSWIPKWLRLAKPERVASRTREGLYDLPLDGAAWLVHFKNQNTPLLHELDLRLSKNYQWNPRESHAAGSPLVDLLDYGVARAKYSCDIVDALITELKIASTAGKCKTLVVLDGYNAFMAEKTMVKDIDFKILKPSKISLVQTFLNLTNSDWCNGAIVMTVDQFADTEGNHESFYPRYLLGKEGFEHLDPFLPIKVPVYSKDEFETVMEYYKDRKWIRDITQTGQRELELLSNRNPELLMKYTGPL